VEPQDLIGQDQLREKGIVLCGRLVEAAHRSIKRKSVLAINKTKGTASDPATLIIFV
jgi:hypothetical protein